MLGSGRHEEKGRRAKYEELGRALESDVVTADGLAMDRTTITRDAV